MKIKHLFGLAVIAAMTASCSSNEDLGTAGPGTGTNEAGVGYVAFNINLPTQSGSSSRAGSENDQFDAGTPNEYDVKDATLLIFEGSSESTAQFKGAYTLNTAPWKDNGKTDNITTTSATIVKQIDTPASSSDHCYALVVLNKNDVFTVNETAKTITLKGAPTTFSGTYKDFAESLSEENLTNNGFYMANAPLASVAGGATDPAGAEINTLATLDGKIKEKESEAKSAPAQIYVERGVAKVTMQNTSSPTKVDGSTKFGGTSTVDFKITSWVLDNTNKKTYLVRSTDGFGDWTSLASNSTTLLPANKYRFIGSNAVATGLYRTYFAKDANFDQTGNNTALADGDLVTKTSPTFVDKFGNDNPQYCFENTFDAACQKDQYTTRVLIKAKLNSGETFYVFNGDQNTIYKKDDVIKEIKKYFLTEYDSWIKANVTIASGSVGEGNLDVDITDNAGDVAINSITFTNGATITAPATLPTGYQQKVKDRIGSIQEYKDGESYYFVRIKHFGDDMTPWNTDETTKPSTSSIYPEDHQAGNYLGRYGVLRNNWYDIAVEGVKGLGSAVVPTVTPNTDDELKSYIAVKINVLSWAKRSQNVVL